MAASIVMGLVVGETKTKTTPKQAAIPKTKTDTNRGIPNSIKMGYNESVKYVITSHAKARMKERGITEKDIKNALQSPTQTLYDEKRTLFKKLYKREGKERMLLVAGERQGECVRVITVIETSKIKKYL